MKRFAALLAELDDGPSTHDQRAALVRYLREAPDEDAAWAMYLLAGGKPPRRLIRAAPLKAAAVQAAGLPGWLFEASLQAVGDLAETIAHVLPHPADGGSALGLSGWMQQRLLPLHGAGEAAVAAALTAWWHELDPPGRFLLTRLAGGGFRVGVSKLLVQRAIAEHTGLDARLVAARMAGFTDGRRAPTLAAWRAVVAPVPAGAAREPSQPYSFFIAQRLPGDPVAVLGAVGDWLAEWRFDGVRGQIVKRAGQVWVWSCDDALMTACFPELVQLAAAWPDGTVIDGEIVAWDAAGQALSGAGHAGGPAPFVRLQRRIARKTLGPKVLAALPVRFIASELLEAQGRDLRALAQHARRAALQRFAQGRVPPLSLSPLLGAADWRALAAQRARAREVGAKGLVLKHREGAYGAGRATGADADADAGAGAGTSAPLAWWQWKNEPLTACGVLIYAQAGRGQGASAHADCTFAVWNRPPRDATEAHAVVQAITERRPADPEGLQLVAFAKARSGLTESELQAVDAAIRQTTLEKFGPVRSVRPTLVVELAFESIARSPRHKSGVALRLPRMLRLREDKPLHEADTLADLQALLA